MVGIFDCTCMSVSEKSKKGKVKVTMISCNDDIVKCLTEHRNPIDISFFDFWTENQELINFKCGDRASCKLDVQMMGENMYIQFVDIVKKFL